MSADQQARAAQAEPVSGPSRWEHVVARLERRLGGEGVSPLPAGWEPLVDGATARVGVAAAPLAGGGYRRDTPNAEGSLSHRAAEQFPAASTMKVYVLLALLEAVAAGSLGLEQRRAVGADDGVSGSGVLKLLSPGTRLTLLDLATLMITVSDNTATNMLIDVLGIETVRESVARGGWSDTYLRGRLQTAPVVAGSKSSPTLTSPRDLADHFTRLWAGELLPADLTDVARGIYRRQQFTELGRSLDYDSYSAEIGVSPLLIASKSGSIRGVRNDAGVMEFVDAPGDSDSAGVTADRSGPSGSTRESFVMAVMTDGCPDRRFHADNLGAHVVGEVAAASLTELRRG